MAQVHDSPQVSLRINSKELIKGYTSPTTTQRFNLGEKSQLAPEKSLGTS